MVAVSVFCQGTGPAVSVEQTSVCRAGYSRMAQRSVTVSGPSKEVCRIHGLSQKVVKVKQV